MVCEPIFWCYNCDVWTYIFNYFFSFMLYSGQKGIFGREDFVKLVDHVTAFSLMTYDYSNSQRYTWYLLHVITNENIKKLFSSV